MKDFEKKIRFSPPSPLPHRGNALIISWDQSEKKKIATRCDNATSSLYPNLLPTRTESKPSQRPTSPPPELNGMGPINCVMGAFLYYRANPDTQLTWYPTIRTEPKCTERNYTVQPASQSPKTPTVQGKTPNNILTLQRIAALPPNVTKSWTAWQIAQTCVTNNPKCDTLFSLNSALKGFYLNSHKRKGLPELLSTGQVSPAV